MADEEKMDAVPPTEPMTPQEEADAKAPRNPDVGQPVNAEALRAEVRSFVADAIDADAVRTSDFGARSRLVIEARRRSCSPRSAILPTTPPSRS